MKQAVLFPLLPALAAALLVACQGGNPASATAVQPTFDDITSKVFKTTCTTSSCHSASAAKGGLQLTSDVAYEQLVNVAADNDQAKLKGKKRVIPGDPASSFLVQKLVGPAPDEGDPMPQRGTKLPDDVIAAIKTWIQNGAKKTATTPAQFHI